MKLKSVEYYMVTMEARLIAAKNSLNKSTHQRLRALYYSLKQVNIYIFIYLSIVILKLRIDTWVFSICYSSLILLFPTSQFSLISCYFMVTDWLAGCENGIFRHSRHFLAAELINLYYWYAGFMQEVP